MAKPKLGSGKRFSNLTAKLAGRGGRAPHGAKHSQKVNNPAALAAYIGRKKFGAKKFNKLAAKGKKGS